MANIVKSIGISLAVTGIVGYIVSRKKIKDALSVIENLSPFLSKINKIDLKLTTTKLNVDVGLINNTNIDFSIYSGAKITLEKLEIYSQNDIKIAEAVKYIENMNLPAYGQVIIPSVDVVIDNVMVIQHLGHISKEKIKIKATVKVFGKIHVI